MQDKERVAPNRYRWLLPVVGLVAATVGGWAVAILGLILSRWLRPFDVAARIGYALCWLTLTVIPAVWIAGSGYWEWSWQRVGPPAGYLLTVAAWWLLRPKLFCLPSAHRAAALGVSLLGAVLTAPGYMGLTVVAPMPYVLAAIGYGSVVPPGADGYRAMLLEGAALMTAILFVAHLAVYWPSRKKIVAAQR